MVKTFKHSSPTELSLMIMKLCMEQYVLKLYKVYTNDDRGLTLTHFKTMSNSRNLFCTYSRPRYQVSVYRTIGPQGFLGDIYAFVVKILLFGFIIVCLFLLCFEHSLWVLVRLNETEHLRLRIGVRAPLGSPCCVLEQDIFTPPPHP